MPFSTFARAVSVVLLAGPLAVACSSNSNATNPGVDAGHDSSHVTSHPDSGRGDAGKTDDSGTVCKAGSSESCQCASSSAMGTHACLTDGSGYGPCTGCAPHVDGGVPTDSGGTTKDGGAHDANTVDAHMTDGSPGDGEMSDSGSGCAQSCATMNMAAYQAFVGDLLTSCGCATGSTCASNCTSECANPSTLTQASPCGACLQAQKQMGESSTCLVSAAGTCSQSSTCEPFAACVEACP